ncbi:hypothetical protein C802_03148 [Phocaeicola sartorii]|jgi:DNA-binding XRE family transcriptional regulator|uniref:XRE family transcriptional regulator n=1 Tax=Phocaeicola sartorii TaxID=671267 RepID=R9I436_9BACT|nr:hypothetical protein C802_03148 [Phocaeicola sartorii]
MNHESLFQLAGLLIEDMRIICGLSINQVTSSIKMNKQTYAHIKKGTRIV